MGCRKGRSGRPTDSWRPASRRPSCGVVRGRMSCPILVFLKRARIGVSPWVKAGRVRPASGQRPGRSSILHRSGSRAQSLASRRRISEARLPDCGSDRVRFRGTRAPRRCGTGPRASFRRSPPKKRNIQPTQRRGRAPIAFLGMVEKHGDRFGSPDILILSRQQVTKVRAGF